MPLRTVCWLLLAVVAGSTIGFKLALPGSDSGPVPAASGTPYSRTFGSDTGISLSPEWSASGFYSKTDNPGVSGATSAWSATLAYNGEFAQGRIERANIAGHPDHELEQFPSRRPGIALRFWFFGRIN